MKLQLDGEKARFRIRSECHDNFDPRLEERHGGCCRGIAEPNVNDLRRVPAKDAQSLESSSFVTRMKPPLLATSQIAESRAPANPKS